MQLLHQDGVKIELGGTFFNPALDPHLAALIEATSTQVTPLQGWVPRLTTYIFLTTVRAFFCYCSNSNKATSLTVVTVIKKSELVTAGICSN